MRLRLTRIEQYVLVRNMIAVAGALAVISSVIFLADFVSVLRDVSGRDRDVSMASVLGLTLLDAPSNILVLLPFTFLFGVLGAYVSLNRRSELIAMRAAGVSAWRFIFPAAGAALLIGVVTVTVLSPLTAVLDGAYQREKAHLLEGPVKPGEKPIWLRQGNGRTQQIIRAASQAPGPGIRLINVTVMEYQVDRSGAAHFARRMDARDARLDGRVWRLTDVREATPGALASHYGSLTLPSTLNERTVLERFSSPRAIPFWSLPGMISRTERAGFSAVTYRLQLHRLLATPVMYAAMSVLAAAFSLRLLRLGGLAGLAAAGVALGFVLFFINELCNALGKSDVIPPLLAAWAPPLLALLAGFTLLCYTEDG
jgi:lipopolysaccharide export system permease protein